jgi:hypothetical protein
VVEMSLVLVYERVECRRCRWFSRKLSREEKLRLPLDVDAVGRCRRERNILVKNSGGASKRCSKAESKRGLNAWK